MSPPLHAIPGPAPPLVQRLLDVALDWAREGHPFALAGLQGSGKSTLVGCMADAAAARGLRAATLSIDDVYLDRPERERLARNVHPLLATRGPPGTHDVALACDVLDRLLAGEPVRLPRFDKVADARRPEREWPRVERCDLVLVEGWFLKTPPQPDADLREPANPVERDEDADLTWRRHCNAALARDYPPLWHRLPRLAFLAPPGFEVVAGWRWQQECALQAANPGRRTMTREEVGRFVQLFERVSRQALATLPAIADIVVPLDAGRVPSDLVRGGGRVLPTMGP